MIPTYNRADRWPALLRALESQTLGKDRFEMIVADDRSTDGTWENLTAMASTTKLDLRLLRTPSNTGGPSTPRNLGWKAARAPIVAFTDDDCLPDPSWLAAGLATMEADPRLGVLQGLTVPPEGVDRRTLGRWHVEREITSASPWFECANIFYRRSAIEEVGGFDEDIPTWGEDTDLGWSVVEAGWSRGFTGTAKVTHEIEDRGWRRAVRFGWLDRNVIKLAAVHPQLRYEGFWRPWAYHRHNAHFAAALFGAVLALKWRPAILLALPYLWWRRPSIRRPGFVAECLKTAAVDGASFAGHVSGSLSARIFVL